MATFEAQVEALTGLSIESSGSVPTQTQLTQFLDDGIIDVTNKVMLLRPQESFKFASESSDSDGSGVEVKGILLSVMRENSSNSDLRPATEIPASLRYLATDVDSLHFRSAYNPAFYLLNGKVYVLPAPSSGTTQAIVSHINYQTTAYNASNIGGTLKIETGITCTNADPSVFTSAGTSFADDDIVELSGFTEQTELNGMSGLIIDDKTTNTFTLKGISVNAETTGGTIQTVASGFPDEYEHQVVLYATAMCCLAKATDIHNALPNKATLPSYSENEVFEIPPAPAPPNFESGSADLPSMPRYEAPDLPTVPEFIEPVLDVSFTNVNAEITDEDPEMVDKEMDKLDKQIEFTSKELDIANKKYEEGLNEFNKEIERLLKNAETNFNGKVQIFSKEIDLLLKNADNNLKKEIDKYTAELKKYELNITNYTAQINEFKVKRTLDIQEHGSNIQKYTAELNEEMTQYKWWMEQYYGFMSEYNTNLGVLKPKQEKKEKEPKQ